MMQESQGLSPQESGVGKNMRELKALGKLKRIGPDKGGYWEVVEN